MQRKCGTCHVQIPLLNFLCSLLLSQGYGEKHTGKIDIIIQQLLELRLRLEVNQLKEMIFFFFLLYCTMYYRYKGMHTHTQAVIFFLDLKGFQEEQLGHVYY